jgi:hypothetical protein
MKYFLTNDLLSERQYGFIKGCFTVMQLLNILDRWTEDLGSGTQIDTIYVIVEKLDPFLTVCKGHHSRGNNT